MKKAVLVLGYNNTRINDVRKIKEKATEYLNAVTVLCKKDPSETDYNAADYVINTGLEATENNVNQVLAEAKKQSFQIIALLPFSDPGTQLGAALAKRLNLKGPDIDLVEAALDKYAFREAEANAVTLPDEYKKIKSEKITSYVHLMSLYESLGGRIFLKPAKEGNSRGCINLMLENDLFNAWSQVEKYLNEGIVAEELIIDTPEYSWDHVDNFSWITEKKTTQSEYRAEIQQIVPAPLSADAKRIVTEAGILMANLAGFNGSACHNEVFYLKDEHKALGVEPNLRPAGMRIWDLASLAFEDFDPWKEWILWARSNNDRKNVKKEFQQLYYAGIRMIEPFDEGIINEINRIDKNSLSNDSVEFMEIVWTKKPGDLATKKIRDNSDFIGYVIARSKDYAQLIEALQLTARNLAHEVIITPPLVG